MIISIDYFTILINTVSKLVVYLFLIYLFFFSFLITKFHIIFDFFITASF